MAVVKLEAMNALVAAIVCEVTELRDRVCIGQADPGHDLGFPHMSLTPIRWKYSMHQAEEVFDPAPDRVVMDVGYHTSIVKIEIGATSSYQRMELEQKVTDVFLGQVMSPGIINTPVLTCSELGEFIASWMYDEDEWVNRQAFDQQFYSSMAIDGVVPALVTRGSSHTIEELRCGITHDSSTIDSDNFDTSPLVEVVQVNQDGTISPA